MCAYHDPESLWTAVAYMTLGTAGLNNVSSVAQALHAHAHPDTFGTDEGIEATSKL